MRSTSASTSPTSRRAAKQMSGVYSANPRPAARSAGASSLKKKHKKKRRKQPQHSGGGGGGHLDGEMMLMMPQRITLPPLKDQLASSAGIDEVNAIMRRQQHQKLQRQQQQQQELSLEARAAAELRRLDAEQRARLSQIIGSIPKEALVLSLIHI